MGEFSARESGYLDESKRIPVKVKKKKRNKVLDFILLYEREQIFLFVCLRKCLEYGRSSDIG